MPSTFFGLTIGKSGIYAANASINTTAHNASNVTTKGYSRQEATQQASTPVSVYTKAGMAGTGVDFLGVKRVRNEYFDDKYRKCNTDCGNYSAKEFYLTSIEGYFSETNTQGVTASMTSFYMSLQDLKDDPADSTARTATIETANSFTEYVNYLATSMQRVQNELNTEIRTTADTVNSIAAQIAVLNKQINTLEVRGTMANDLRDQRDLLVDQLSEFANISVSEVNVGEDRSMINQYVIKLDGKTLVDTYHYNTLVVKSCEGKVNENDINGMYEISWSDGQEFNSASTSLGGKLQALFELRDGNNGVNFKGKVEGTPALGDTSIVIKETNCNEISKLNIPASNGTIIIGNKEYMYDYFELTVEADGTYSYEFFGLKDDGGNVGLTKDAIGKYATIGNSIQYKGIPYYQAQLNEFVRTYSAQFNAIHNQGEDLMGNAGLDLFNGTHAASGLNFDFVETLNAGDKISSTVNAAAGANTVNGSYYHMTAMNFTVNQAILDDPQMIACAKQIEDGVESTEILDLLIGLKEMGTMFQEGTPSEFLESFTANIGIDTQQATLFTTNQSNILHAIDTQRMSISSVDQDEEAMNLMKFQNAYELSSKVIAVMNEIYEQLINRMGV